MTATETIRFKNDTAMRRRLFDPESFAHPAKGQSGLWQLMVERYSHPGDLILDPMAGIGTSLLAALMGRNVVCVELEPHFVEPMRRSWKKMRNIPMLGFSVGEATIIQGDARCLPLPDTSVEVALTSPPYEGSLVVNQNGIDEAKLQAPYGPNSQFVRPQMYTRPQVSAIITSPPFQLEKRRNGSRFQGGNRDAYGDRVENIGNLRSDAYWEAMGQTYTECWRVLRPGGLLALVLKGFTRDGKYVDLPGQTEALLLAAGWKKHDHWRRELWSLSFWRTLQKRRDPAAFDGRLNYEEVLAFRKPGTTGHGVAAILTSPPYEGSLQGDEPTGKLFETERRVNSPASGNRKSLRKPLGHGYSKLQSPGREGVAALGGDAAATSDAEMSSFATMVEGHWLTVHDGDPRALALFKRHYSYRRRAHGQQRGNSTFVGQGEKMVLLTPECNALFVWQRSTVERRDGQIGIRCSVFRNEGFVLSSLLIREAVDLASSRWPGARLFTYVADKKIQSVNPGYCFKMAGWRYCGRNADGRLSILEVLPLPKGGA